MAHLKISVIIPVYNVEPYIEDCLKSVMNQTFLGTIECIIVDDCGQDRSVEILEQMIAEYHGPIEFKVLHHDENLGLSEARNTGVKAATGDYIYFLDSDDYISEDCLDVLSRPLFEHDYDLVVGDLQSFGESSDFVWLHSDSDTIIGNEAVFHEFYVNCSVYVMSVNKMVKASLFTEYDLSFLKGQINEDELWTYKIAFCASSMCVIKKTTYYYRIREDSIMHSEYSSQLKLNKAIESRYHTIEYVLGHRAQVPAVDWSSCVSICIDRYIGTILLLKSGFRKDYLALRNIWGYHPVKSYLSGEISFRAMIRDLHWSLPPVLGYVYLRLRRLKKRLVS